MLHDTDIRWIIDRTISWGAQAAAFAGVPVGIGVCLLLAASGATKFEAAFLFGYITAGLIGLLGATIGFWSALVHETLRMREPPNHTAPVSADEFPVPE